MSQVPNTDSQNQPNTTAGAQANGWKPEDVPQLTVDVYRNGDKIFVVSTVAGVKPEDLDISIENNTLSIKGIRQKPYSPDNSMVLLEECFWGEFYRELTINESLDVEQIKASLENGVLMIEIPILKLSTHKKITISSAG